MKKKNENIILKLDVTNCDLCGKLNETKSVFVRPKGFIFKFQRKIKVDICQSCISTLFRGCYKSI